MKNIVKMKNSLMSVAALSVLTLISTACTTASSSIALPSSIMVNGVAQNPEGIEYDKNDHTFLLSSLNAAPIIKVNTDGTFKAFTSGEKFPLSSAGLQIDYKHNRLLVAGFNGMELMDKKPETKGISFLRVYNLKTGVLEKDINLSHLAPHASAYFANDIAVDDAGNAYISDWYAKVIYKVDLSGKATLFWRNETVISGGPNGLDCNSDGFLLVSLLNVNAKGLYSDYGLIKIPLEKPSSVQVVTISDSKFSGFDGMVINEKGNVIGVSNNQKTPGGNTLLELSTQDNWKSAKVLNVKAIKASTTVAITPENDNYVINQDFTRNFAKSWHVEKISF